VHDPVVCTLFTDGDVVGGTVVVGSVVGIVVVVVVGYAVGVEVAVGVVVATGSGDSCNATTPATIKMSAEMPTNTKSTLITIAATRHPEDDLFGGGSATRGPGAAHRGPTYRGSCAGCHA
jgi:hypothetical protein